MQIFQQDFYLDSLSEDNIYRRRYYSAPCKLLAFRYLDQVQVFDSPTRAIAQDVSRLIVEAKRKYMSTEGRLSYIDGRVFLDSMKKVLHQRVTHSLYYIQCNFNYKMFSCDLMLIWKLSTSCDYWRKKWITRVSELWIFFCNVSKLHTPWKRGDAAVD